MLLIGTGILNWNREERQSDRYGSIFLYDIQNEEEFSKIKKAKGQGSLVVEVVNVRPIAHVGDFQRGIKPGGSKKGLTLTLGSGKLFYKNECVGVEPIKARGSDWMDPKKLYQVHNQEVKLYFKKDEK